MEKRPTRYFSSAQEGKVARSLGGKRTPNSGATPFAKGDVVSGDFLVECKTTETVKSSYSVKRDTLEKLDSERIATRKGHCALAFDFGPGTPTYYVVDEYTFKKMKEALEARR